MNLQFFSRPLVLVGIIVFLLFATVPSVYFYNQYRQATLKLQNPSDYAKEDARLLIEKAGKLIELPAFEQPTIATVTDAEKLRSQPFFANVQIGDRVLIYTEAKKAFLYRPSTNKIIEVAPVNIGPNASASAQLRTQATPSAIPGTMSQPVPISSIDQVSPTPISTPPVGL